MSLESGGISANSLQTLESLRVATVKKQEASSSSDNSEPKKISIHVASDKLFSSKIPKGSVPKTDENISVSLSDDKRPTKEDSVTFTIGGRSFDAYPVTEGIELQEAVNITKDNGIDELFIKDEEGKLYVAYGDKNVKGSLDLNNLKESYIGKIGNRTAKIVSINNETNTIKEGALSPLKSTWSSVKEAGSTGVAKGITEMGTTLVAIFVGKSIVQNGITAAQTANEAAQAAGGTAQVVKGLVDAGKVIGRAQNTGKAVVETIGSGLRQVGVGVVVSGVVIGVVAGSMATYGAIRARNPRNDFSTIGMITDPDLAFKAKSQTPANSSAGVQLPPKNG